MTGAGANRTAIKVPGKRTRSTAKADVAARNTLNRPPGRPLKATPSETSSLTSEPPARAHKKAKMRLLKNIKSKRQMSSLERLPTELLEEVFFYSMNLDLPRSSPVIGGKLSSEAVYTRTILTAFEATWEAYYPDHRCTYDQASAGHTELQSAILRCRWVSLSRLLKCQDICWRRENPSRRTANPIRLFSSLEIDPTILSLKTVAENFKDDFTQFLLQVENYPQNRNSRQCPSIFWSTFNDTDLAAEVEIPHVLLRGPWTEGTVQYLYWMLKSGARINWRNSTNGEVAFLGLKRAIIAGDLPVVNLLIGAGVVFDEEFLTWAYRNSGQNNYQSTIASSAAMRPTLHIPVPSSALLEFLKVQSESICFFSTNPRPGFTFDHAAPRGPLSRSHIVKTVTKPITRGLSTAVPGNATIEAGFLNFDFLWPRSITPRLLPRSSRNVSRGKDQAHSNTPASQCRSASSRSSKWHEKLWGVTSKKGGRPLRPDDLPGPLHSIMEDGSDSMFKKGRSISAKAAAQPKLRCTELDENGNVVLASGEFKKSELIAKYGLLPRDLRKIDSSLLPHMLVRKSAILINLLHLRVLIKANRVLIFDAYGSTNSYNQSAFIYDLEDKLRQKQGSLAAGGLPYEFRALEAVLVSVVSSLEKEFEGVREPVVTVLRQLEEDIDRDKLRQLLIYSKKLGTFEQKAKLVRDAIDELLEADDDLAAMYLTEKNHDLVRGNDDHTEIEMLLESYHKLCDEIVQESGNLVSNIRNTEEIVKAILDANRNSLMLLDLKFSIGTLGIGSGAFIAALYGMNLKNFIEESDLGFLGVTGWCAGFAGIVCAYGLTKLRKVQRVSMWGESGRKGPNWRHADGRLRGELDLGRRERNERQRRLKEERNYALDDMKSPCSPVKPERDLAATKQMD